jgi:hypothetical protein
MDTPVRVDSKLSSTRIGAADHLGALKIGMRILVALILAFPLLQSLASGATAAGPSSPTGIVRVRIVGPNGEATPARAWVDDASGNRLFQPREPSTCTPYPRDRSFSCDGWFELAAPAGRVVVHVEKGKEYTPVDRTVELRSGGVTDVSIRLDRWVDMPARGYYSADLHVHFGHDNPVVLRQLSLADDVHVVPAFTYWLRGREQEWRRDWPAWEEGDSIRVDSTHFVTRSNLEIERISPQAAPSTTVGASFLFNLRKPVWAERFDERFPTDTSLCLAAKKVSPDCVIDTDKPSWAETPIGAALGVYDVAQVCHNHYHRSVTQRGGWGMIETLAADEKDMAEPDELFRRTNTHYYHWLNCGIRMGVSGGSAMGVKAVPLGYSRTYAKVDGALTPEKFWRAVKAGNTFATSGPMLTMSVDAREPGAAVRRSSTDRSPLRIESHLQSIDAVQTVELVENGGIVRREQVDASTGGVAVDRRFAWEIVPERSGWYAVRALYLSPDRRLRQAHTSPVYVSIDDRPIAFRRSAEYMIRWVDRLIEVAGMPDRYHRESDRSEVLAQYWQARRFYEAVARAAHDHWRD